MITRGSETSDAREEDGRRKKKERKRELNMKKMVGLALLVKLSNRD